MKKLITVSLLLFFCGTIKAQVFTGTGGAILNNGQNTYFALSVSGLSPAQLDGNFGLEQVCFNINHPDISELYIYLQSPAGTIVELTLGSSASGTGYVNTCLNNQAGSSVTMGTTPYSGNFKPVGFLGRFNTGQTGNGTWNLVVHDGFINANSGTVINWNISFGNSPPPPVAFTSSNLPIIFITTSQPITDTKSLANMGVIDNGANRNYTTDPFNNYNGKVSIHLRGSSTKNFEKKSYSIETADMSGVKQLVSLLGMPIESDWDLVSVYQDKSLVRDPLTYDLSRSMGHYAPRYRNVEVVLNNEYQGIYEVTEKPKRDSNRVHVNVMTETQSLTTRFCNTPYRPSISSSALQLSRFALLSVSRSI